jgi:putative transposon-encoded protein
MANKDESQEETESDYRETKVKFEIYGREMIEKVVNSSGNSGRVYLPPDWIGTKVKVVKC